MKDLLINDLVKNIWIYPEEDKQHIEIPVELSKRDGVLNVFKYPFVDNLKMPAIGRRFMLFQVGHLIPENIGIENVDLTRWVRVDRLVDTRGLMINFIIDDKLIDLKELYVIVLPNRLTLLALDLVKYRKLMLNAHNVFFRTYSNRLYSEYSGEFKITYDSSPINDIDYPAALTEYNELVDKFQKPLFFADGRLVIDPSYQKIRTFSECSIQTDPLITGRFEYEIDESKWYYSPADKKSYTILINENISDVNHRDDTDFFLVGKLVNEIGVRSDIGVYIVNYRNHVIKTLSQTTYAVDNAVLNRIKVLHSDIDFTNPKIVAVTRLNDDYKRIVGDGNYLQQLNELSVANRNQFLTNVNSNINLWKADNLDDSKFTEVMQMSTPKFEEYLESKDGFRGTYSYFGLMELLEGDDPDRDIDFLRSGNKLMLVSKETSFESPNWAMVTTVHEYNLFRETYPRYRAIPFIRNLDEPFVYNESNDFHDGVVGKKRYTRLSSQYEWKEAKLGTDYVIKDGKAVWSTDLHGQEKYSRSAGDVLIRDMLLRRSDLSEWISLTDKDIINDPSFLESSRYDVYLNNRLLIPEVDYLLDWPSIKIFNLEHILDGDVDNKVFVLGHGLPKISEAEYTPIKHGWVSQNSIVSNNKYDLIENVCSDVFINGINVSEYKRAETGKGTMPHWVKNGMPYSVLPRVQHYDDELLGQFSMLREESVNTLLAMENAISLIQDENIPKPPVSNSEFQYKLVSPLISTLVSDIKSRKITIPSGLPNFTEEDLINGQVVEVNGTASDVKIASLILPYDRERLGDPCFNRLDSEMFVIYPTHLTEFVTLTEDEYYFIARVNKLYLNGRCNLSHGLAIGV